MMKSSFHWNCWALLLTLVRPVSQPIFSTDSYLSSLACLLAQSLPQTPLVRFLSVRLFSKPSPILRKKLRTMRITYQASSPGSQLWYRIPGHISSKEIRCQVPKMLLTPQQSSSATAFSCPPCQCPSSWHLGDMHPSITTTSREWAAEICRWCQRPRISKWDCPIRWSWSGNAPSGSNSLDPVHWSFLNGT